jgi:aspartyl-tRNA(Asn)/glutamyl-tRNA(Gln) amidotransferase subunit A
VGMQVIGKPFNEKTLLKISFAFEKNTDFSKRKPSL